MAFRISIKNLESLGFLNPDQIKEIKRKALESAALWSINRLAVAPQKAVGAFTRLATPVQRRAYWARVGAGKIRHDPNSGYVRTGDTIRKWTYTKTENRYKRVTIANKAPGAPYLYGAPEDYPKTQTAFNRASGWPRIDEWQAENKQKLEDVINDVIQREIKK
jgi:hypothetical protein